MTEDQGNTPDTLPQAGGPTEATTGQPTTPADPAYKAKAPKGTEGTGRFAVWDSSLERYVGPVTTGKPTAADARKLAPNGYAVVEV